MKSYKIKQDLIDSIKEKNFPVRDIIIGANLTILESIKLGMASTILNTSCKHKILDESGELEQFSLESIINMLHSKTMLKASLGMAALNSLIDIDDNWRRGNAFEIIQAKAKQKNVGVIGHFPFVDLLRKTAENCWVFEQKPNDDDLPAEAIADYLPRCDVVVITGQTIINNTIGKILSLSEKAYKIILGPSSPLSPVLFDYGIDVIGGVCISDIEKVKRYVVQGAKFKQLEGVELVTLVSGK
jgi:uncharacterized protein (DUF4213/DUF364 family)